MSGPLSLKENEARSQKGTTMNNLTRWENRWNPFKEMEDLQSRLFGLMNRNFSRQGLTKEGEQEEAMSVSQWAPLVDVAEDEKGYLIKAELPEIKKDEVKVTLENGVLTITGERKFEKEEKNKRYHRVERAYGTFARSFTLPDDAEADHVSAEFRDGVLQVRIAKSEKARPRSIDVKVA
jgi:HSP20 family protein